MSHTKFWHCSLPGKLQWCPVSGKVCDLKWWASLPRARNSANQKPLDWWFSLCLQGLQKYVILQTLSLKLPRVWVSWCVGTASIIWVPASCNVWGLLVRDLWTLLLRGNDTHKSAKGSFLSYLNVLGGIKSLWRRPCVGWLKPLTWLSYGRIGMYNMCVPNRVILI